ncbi:hypothetical protein ANN_06349 [Periplaneta americana]|uniref:Uncharacterized protein n=1 Tax=Periplaneta americana TaxID=6978 RepID=A0ABQ8TDB2_PERAM|nr:hypothetical protein ANN_06349 [Periplaneta americana]
MNACDFNRQRCSFGENRRSQTVALWRNTTVKDNARPATVVGRRCLRWAGHVASVGESRIAYRVLFVRPEGKSPLGRPRCRWEDNIKMDLREVGYDDRDWINLAQDRNRWQAYVRGAMNIQIP